MKYRPFFAFPVGAKAPSRLLRATATPNPPATSNTCLVPGQRQGASAPLGLHRRAARRRGGPDVPQREILRPQTRPLHPAVHQPVLEPVAHPRSPWDPTLPGTGTNRYAYAQNDPVNLCDPNGHVASGLGTNDDGVGGTGFEPTGKYGGSFVAGGVQVAGRRFGNPRTPRTASRRFNRMVRRNTARRREKRRRELIAKIRELDPRFGELTPTNFTPTASYIRSLERALRDLQSKIQCSCPPRTVATRVTRKGELAVRITEPDGTILDISPSRVKGYKPVKDPRAPSGKFQRTKFDNAIPGSKGYKREPTQQELDFLKGFIE